MDSLLAFWPGLQVLWGDVESAIHTHDMLYHVTERYNFLPEAFTLDFRIHWGNHPLRPEFTESTYFLHQVSIQFTLIYHNYMYILKARHLSDSAVFMFILLGRDSFDMRYNMPEQALG